MGSCYELSIIHITEQVITHRPNGTTTRTDKKPFCDRMFEPEPEAREILDKILAKYNKDPWGFFFHLDISLKSINLMPWAMIFCEDAMPIGGHLASIRKNKNDIRFTDISVPFYADTQKINASLVSLIMVKSKQILHDLTTRTPFFDNSWELLKDNDESRHWICFPDPPPNDWLLKTAQGDDEMYRALAKI